MRGNAAVLGILSLALASESCVVSERCFKNDECPAGQVCSASGRCVPGSRPDLKLQPDGKAPVRCLREGTVLIAESFCIDTYEASRLDATATDAGSDGSRATSRPGVLPWQVKSNAEAEQACVAAGKRLCTPGEWQLACQGPKQTVYGYGDQYDPKTCNGIDAFEEWQFHLMPTGSFPSCGNGWGAFDLNGNLWEHIAGGSEQTIRGGAYNCSDSKTLHRCDYVPGNWAPTARGFRCCSEGTPVTVDAGTLDFPLKETGCLPDPEGGTKDGASDAPRDGAKDVNPQTDQPSDAVKDGKPLSDGAPGACPFPEMAAVEGSFCVDLYEASRPDATASFAGVDSSKATNRPGVLPWQVMSNLEAATACLAAGKRLCTPAEWLTACQGAGKTVYGYGDTYQPTTCNGIDTYPSWGFHLDPTGSFPACKSSYGPLDMNGNLWEHTAGGDNTTVRGGAYNCGDSMTYHRCDYIPTVWTPSAQGFRCCANLNPPG